MSLLHPAWRTILKRQAPLVKLISVLTSVLNNTVYTFSVNSIDLGVSMITTGQGDTDLLLRSNNNRIIVAIIHGADSQTAYTISSVSLGGVNGTVSVDIGGVGNVSTVGIVYWTSLSLAGISGTDIVVTFSEAVTSCSVGLLSIDNVAYSKIATPGSTSATGNLAVSQTILAEFFYTFPVCIVGSTCAAVEVFQIVDQQTTGVNWDILYDQNNAEISYAAAWSYSPQFLSDNSGLVNHFAITANWSAAGASSLAPLIFA